jgi:phage N-6-adenine-methyltransferase
MSRGPKKINAFTLNLMEKNVGKGMTGAHLPVMLKDEWLTPPEILEKLGKFDLDPCHPVSAPWVFCPKFFTIKDNGLEQEWFGRVWLNPPYGLEAAKWLDRLANHGNGIALIFARTETAMFFDHVWDKADALLFIKGRLFFHHVSGERAKSNSGAPSVLIAYGKDNAQILSSCGIPGKFINLDKER